MLGKFAVRCADNNSLMGGRSIDGTAQNEPSNARNPGKDNLILEKYNANECFNNYQC